MFVSFALGFAMVKAAAVVVLGLDSRKPRLESLSPGEVAVVLGVGILGAAMVCAAWKASRSQLSLFWPATLASLLALTLVAAFLSDFRHRGSGWVVNAVFPAAALVLLLWPSPRRGATDSASSLGEESASEEASPPAAT